MAAPCERSDKTQSHLTAANCGQISDCLGMVEEAQVLLQGAYAAERMLVAVQRKLGEIGGEPGDSPRARPSRGTSCPARPFVDNRIATDTLQSSRVFSPPTSMSSHSNGNTLDLDDASKRKKDRVMQLSTSNRPVMDCKLIEAMEMPDRLQSASRMKRQSTTVGRYYGLTIKRRCGVPLPIVNPDCSFRFIWDIFGMCSILYETYAIPFNIAFDCDPEGIRLIIVSVINLYFILDVILSFLTGFKNAAGFTVVNPSRIATRYVRSWFLPDLTAAIPWEWIMITSRNSFYQLTKMIRFLRIAKLLRLLKIFAVSGHTQVALETNPGLAFAAGVTRVFFFLVGITHWLACGWYMIGIRDVGNESTWVAKYIPQGFGIGVNYLYSCFFTLTTMTTVGYGDITAQNPGEVAFVVFLLLVAAIIFPGILGLITELLDELNAEKVQIDIKMQTLGKYMRWRKVPNALFWDIRSHLQFLWETKRGYDAFEEEVKAQLPPTLRKELCHHVYGAYLRDAPFFAWMRDVDRCLKELSDVIEIMIMFKGDRLFRVGMPNEQIYILLDGTVRLSLNENLFHSERLVAKSEDEEDIQEDDYAEDEFPPSIQRCKSIDSVAFKGVSVIDSMSIYVRRNKSVGKSDYKYEGEEDGSKLGFMEKAAVKLMEIDQDRKWAASFIQRRWRVWNTKRRRSSMCLRAAHGHVKTMLMAAPAYFGESCLWAPIEEWDRAVPATYTYNVQCESRAELVYISRNMIKDVIDRFSPWLLERFETFREAVHDAYGADCRQSRGQNSSQGRNGSTQRESPKAAPNSHATASICETPNSTTVGGSTSCASATVPETRRDETTILDWAAREAFQDNSSSSQAFTEMWTSIQNRAEELARHSKLAASRLDRLGRGRNFQACPSFGDLPAMPKSERERTLGLQEPFLKDGSGMV